MPLWARLIETVQKITPYPSHEVVQTPSMESPTPKGRESQEFGITTCGFIQLGH